MKTNQTYNKWLEAAYTEFAENGPEFSLKALSKKTALPRATFYYHFDNKHHLIKELLCFHENINESFQKELIHLQALIPDLYNYLFNFKLGVQFHQQLLRNCHNKEYYELYCRCNKGSITIMLPHIKQYYGFDQSDEEVFRFYNTVTDAWYSKLDFSNFSAAYMTSLAEEIMENILILSYNYQH